MSVDNSFLFLNTSSDTLDLKLNVKRNLTNIHISRDEFVKIASFSTTCGDENENRLENENQ